MFSKNIFTVLILFLISVLPATATLVEGSNKDYAGKELKFFRYSDPVTKEKLLVFTLEIDADGNFSSDIDITETTFVFCEFGIYRGLLFIEPDSKLQLRLPPVREKAFADQKNPFFQPVEFWFSTQQGNHLNDKVAAFDATLNQLTDKHFNQLYFRQSKAIFDTITNTLTKQFSSLNSLEFQAHKTLKLQAIKADAFRLKPSDLSETFISTNSLYWTYPAFIELFDKTFDNKLGFEIKKVDNTEIIKAVARANTNFLLKFSEENYGLKSPVTELAVLKMLHDGFYSGEFPQKAIVNILSSAKLQNNPNKKIAEIAQNVMEKLDFLLPGSKAPVICLKNTDGNEVCTDQNNEKFKYLIFADTEMIVCREHLKYLQKIEEQFNEHLEIFVILRKTDLIEMKIFLGKQEIPGAHLIDETGETIKQYRIKSFPAGILLNENHEVIFSPANAPLDGFEQQFGKFLQRKLFERQRNQAR